MKIYHNPRCSKSRKALELLEAKSIDIEVIKYLEAGITAKQVHELCTLLGKDVHEFIRKKEEEFKNAKIDWEDNDLATKELIQSPQLLERPIVIKKQKAIIARPPEELEKLFL